MGKYPRKKMWIDGKVQGALVGRLLMYWLSFVVGMFGLLAGFPVLATLFVDSPGVPTSYEILVKTWSDFWPAIFASLLMLPLLVLDMIKVSNRFAGPLYRLRRALRELADGKPAAPVKFRKGDFWFDLAEEFNRAAARVNSVTATQPDQSGATNLGETVVEDRCASV